MPKYDHIHDREAMVDKETQPFRGDEHLRVSGRIGVDEPANNNFAQPSTCRVIRTSVNSGGTVAISID
jgi:hypothetical protein